jgi:hypothetical protein
MKSAVIKLFFSLVFLFPVLLLAQSGSPAPVAVVPAGGLFSPALVGIILSVVISANYALSAVQSIFTQWSKSEPSWLQKLSSVVAKLSQWAAGNPQL